MGARVIARLSLITRLIAERARYRMALEAIVVETTDEYSSAAQKAHDMAQRAIR